MMFHPPKRLIRRKRREIAATECAFAGKDWHGNGKGDSKFPLMVLGTGLLVPN